MSITSLQVRSVSPVTYPNLVMACAMHAWRCSAAWTVTLRLECMLMSIHALCVLCMAEHTWVVQPWHHLQLSADCVQLDNVLVQVANVRHSAVRC